MTFHAQALVRTTNASAYAAQIADELSHEFDTEWAAESGVISLPDGICDMHTWPEGLRLDVFAESREGLARIEEVVRHQLQRAGATESLNVEWRLRPAFSLS